MIVFENGQIFADTSAIQSEKKQGGQLRRCLEITLAGSDYQSIQAAFCAGEGFIVRRTETGEDGAPKTVDYPKTDFTICGSIKDTRDGSFVVEMFQKTDLEIQNESLEAENAALLFENLTGGTF